MTSSTEADATNPVANRRIEAVLAALSCASVEMFDAPEAQLTPAAEDQFGYLEGALAIFLSELAEAKRLTSEALAESERAREESEAAREELSRKLTLIDQQRHTIRALSTPIIDLWDGVLTLPIVGTLDSQRTVEMTENLLDRIVAVGAREVIIDLTGVDVVDTMTADHLGKLTRAAALLGTRCTITGIGPHIARTLVSIGVNLEGVRTLRTLQDGLRAAIAEQSAVHANHNTASALSPRGQHRP